MEIKINTSKTTKAFIGAGDFINHIGPNDEQLKALTALIKAYIPEGEGTFDLQITASNDGDGQWSLLHQSLRQRA